jgi:hypothetical protein
MFSLLRSTCSKNSPLLAMCGLAICGILAVGCSREAAVHSASISPSTHQASVPPEVTTYAFVVGLTLKSSVDQGTALLASMKRWSAPSLSIPCAELGQQLAYQYEAFRTMYTPRYVAKAQSQAVAGYKLALSGLDECGNAADGNDSHAMKTAARDFAAGVGEVSRAERVIAAWNVGAH